MAISIIKAEDLKFLMFVNNFGDIPPIPLRRAFSLNRLNGFKTLVWEMVTWPEGCSEQKCSSHFKRCDKYVSVLPEYNCILKNRICHKLLFFKSAINKDDKIEELTDDCLLSYCIIHQDKYTMTDSPGIRERNISYAKEILITPQLDTSHYTFGNSTCPISIKNKIFRLHSNYFSQQNTISDCCARIAIKTAIKSFVPDITSEEINKLMIEKHPERKRNEGLTARDITEVIKELSGKETFSLSCSDMGLESSLDFLRVVYLSLESRLPVILLFKMPGKQPGEVIGHAIALIGHTFNAHNWWSYSLTKGYFAQRHKQIQYLPSSLWCDKFIIQDDNLGPFYLLPVRFLTDCCGLSGILLAIEKAMLSTTTPVIVKDSWLDQPVRAIIVYPKSMSFVKNSLKVEPWAISILNQYVPELIEDKTVQLTEGFDNYFSRYHKDKELILLTFILSKQEYMTFLERNKLLVKYMDRIEQHLPNIFWITEISVPELFWVNKKKVGDIITDPTLFSKSEDEGVILIRLPSVIGFIEKQKDKYINLQVEDMNYQELIEPKGLFNL